MLLAGSAVAGAVLIASEATANTPLPARSYRVVTGGGEFVFVMIGLWPPHEDPDTAAIRAGYKLSGMYRNDGSAEPLWVFGNGNGYVYRDDLMVFPDGVHLVTRHRWPSDPSHTVVAFHVSGQVVREYSVQELVDDPGALYVVRPGLPHYEWLRRLGCDDRRMECVVETADGNRFVFDVRTGQVLSESRPVQWETVVKLFALVGVAVTIAGGLALRRRRRLKRLLKNAEPFYGLSDLSENNDSEPPV